jgi:hypothetical protein
VVVDFHSSFAFLENNLVYTILDPLGKKRVRVYEHAIDRTPDLIVHEFLLINITLLFSFYSYAWETV